MHTLEILNNGSRVLLAPQAGTETVTVLVLVKVGSRYEPANVNGISHFIEHLLFKGTRRRPTSLDITKELDGVGADFNAFTAKDHTGYYVRVNHENLELALDIVSDMLMNPLFNEADIEKERGVISEEINMYEDNPLLMIENFFEEAVFSGNSLAKLISGPKNIIQKITKNEITDYFYKNYASKNVLIAAGGKINSLKTKKLIRNYFAQPPVRHPNKQTTTYQKFASRQKFSRIKIKTKETEQVHLALGFPGYSLTDPRLYPLSLLSIILGGNMSSRLFMEIREKLGLAYYIKAYADSYEDTGAFAVYAGLDKQKIELAIKIIIKELQKIISEKVTPQELIRAKEFVKGKTILRLEDSSQYVQWLAAQQLFKNKIETMQQHLRKVESVTAGQIQRAARDVIKNSKINLAIIGPYNGQKKFHNIIKFNQLAN